MPLGDQWPKGATTAMRMAAAGLTNTAASDYTCTQPSQAPCSAGVNMAKLESDLGIVSHISLVPAANTATFTYLAPDSRVCSADVFAG